MRKAAMIPFLFLFCALLQLSTAAPAAVIHVPGDQPNIQAGINLAGNGDTVLVADGTWTGSGNKNLDTLGKAITVRSANGPANCVIDCQGSGRGFYIHRSEFIDTVIHGFTITNGSATEGGGILCDGASPLINRNRILLCSAGSGGGIGCVSFGGAVIINNEIAGCTAGSPGDGGGVYFRQITIAQLAGNRINGNQAVNGGGVCSRDGSYLYIKSNRIHGNMATYQGGGVYGNQGYLSRNTIEENEVGGTGGGIFMMNGPVSVNSNIVRSNVAQVGGGLAILGCSDCTVSSNRFIGNEGDGGAGIALYESSTIALHNTLSGNHSTVQGGALYLNGSSMFLSHATLQGNTAGSTGGGVYATDSTINGDSCIIWGNSAPVGSQIHQTGGSTVEFDYSDVQGGWQGIGNLNTDPLFVAGPLGSFYLSQQAAGQTQNSPCLDSGDPAPPFPLSWGTTRTDCVLDQGVTDMGSHYRSSGLAVGPGPGYDNPPRVRLFPPVQGAQSILEFNAYGAPHYGVNVTCGDVDGDEYTDELITGPGPGAIYGPHVRGFDISGAALSDLSFLAYGTQKYGVNVACGNLDGDAADEIITGAGPGAVFGPHVRAFDYTSGVGVSPMPGVSFFAYGTPKWGVNVACGNIDPVGGNEIVTGAGPGAVFGPHVRAWKVDNGSVSPIAAVSFFAYGTPRYGVNVACGDVDGDGIDEIITAPGPSASFGANIRGWDYDGAFVSLLPGFDFFAWGASQARYGARASARADLDGDGRAEVVVGQGPGPTLGSEVKVYRYDGAAVSLWYSLLAFDAGWTQGVNATGWACDLDLPPI